MTRWYGCVPTVLVMAALSSAAAPRWIRAESENFEIYTSAGEKRAREILRYFEQVRGFFLEAMPNLRSTAPVRIVAFSSRKEYEPYRMNAFAAAYYKAGAERDYIVLGGGDAHEYPVAIHEYVHLLVRHSGIALPAWLNEGLAEVYSTLQPRGDKVLVGSLIAGRHQALLNDKWTPLSIILAVDHKSPYYNEKEKAGSFYNESWALAHMLMLSEEYRGRTQRFLGKILTGSDSAAAFLDVYGKSVEAVEKDLSSYLRRNLFSGALFDVKLTRVRQEMPALPADDFDVRLIQAELLGGPDAAERRRSSLQELAASGAGRPEPHAALGYIAWQEGRRDEAREQFRKAFALGGRSPRFLWDYGRLAASEDREEAIRAFSELLTQQPDRADARVDLAAMHLSVGDTKAALATLAPIRKVTPTEAPRFFQVLAFAHLRDGNKEEARAAGERWLNTAADAEKRTARSFLDRLEPREMAAQEAFRAVEELRRAERPVIRRGDPPAPEREAEEEQTTPGRPEATGLFVELECLGSRAKVILRTGGGRKAFLVDDPNGVVLLGSDSGAVNMQCGPQKPRPVRIEYDPADGPSRGVEGSVRLIDFKPNQP